MIIHLAITFKWIINTRLHEALSSEQLVLEKACTLGTKSGAFRYKKAHIMFIPIFQKPKNKDKFSEGIFT